MWKSCVLKLDTKKVLLWIAFWLLSCFKCLFESVWGWRYWLIWLLLWAADGSQILWQYLLSIVCEWLLLYFWVLNLFLYLNRNSLLYYMDLLCKSIRSYWNIRKINVVAHGFMLRYLAGRQWFALYEITSCKIIAILSCSILLCTAQF